MIFVVKGAPQPRTRNGSAARQAEPDGRMAALRENYDALAAQSSASALQSERSLTGCAEDAYTSGQRQVIWPPRLPHTDALGLLPASILFGRPPVRGRPVCTFHCTRPARRASAPRALTLLPPCCGWPPVAGGAPAAGAAGAGGGPESVICATPAAAVTSGAGALGTPPGHACAPPPPRHPARARLCTLLCPCPS